MTTVPYDQFDIVFGQRRPVKWKPKYEYPKPEHLTYEKDGFSYRYNVDMNKKNTDDQA